MVQLLTEDGSEIKFPGSETPVQYFLPPNALLSIRDGEIVEMGGVVARIPQESSKLAIYHRGLPRVADLFEARKPKEPAILAEISGIVSFAKETKGKSVWSSLRLMGRIPLSCLFQSGERSTC